MSLDEKSGIVVATDGTDIALSIHRRNKGYHRGNNEFCTILIDPLDAKQLGESITDLAKKVLHE